MLLRRRLVHLLGVLVLVMTCSCSSGDDDGTTGTTTAPLTAEAVLERSASAMAEVRFVAFELRRTGADVALDPGGQLVFDSAEGRYAAPSSSEARIGVTVGGFHTRVAAVVIDGETWITNPLTGRWEDAPASVSFDPAVLFDPATGWPALLRDGLESPQLVEDGDDRQHVRGTLPGAQVATLTGGLTDEPTVVDLWIDAESGKVEECRFEAPTDDGTSAWTLELREYGKQATIERPELGSSG
jgi:hypothetical protein